MSICRRRAAADASIAGFPADNAHARQRRHADARAETQADAPQLAEDWSDDPGLTALAPEAPQVTDAGFADVTVVETDESKSREKRDRSSKDGNSHENSSRRTATTPWAGRWRLSIWRNPRNCHRRHR